MHIRDFHLKFISCNEEGDLLGALRRLSRLESPQAMMTEGTDSLSNDWIVWGDAEGSSLSSSLVTA